jgi:hypothetical protein
MLLYIFYCAVVDIVNTIIHLSQPRLWLLALSFALAILALIGDHWRHIREEAENKIQFERAEQRRLEDERLQRQYRADWRARNPYATGTWPVRIDFATGEILPPNAPPRPRYCRPLEVHEDPQAPRFEEDSIDALPLYVSPSAPDDLCGGNGFGGSLPGSPPAYALGDPPSYDVAIRCTTPARRARWAERPKLAARLMSRYQASGPALLALLCS